MKCTEELVDLLQRLNINASTETISTEILAEAEHEELIVRNSDHQFELTPLGQETLTNINQHLISANQLKLHEHAKIAFVSQRNYARFQKLCAFGLSAGVPVILRQKFPSFVLQCEETQIALEEEIARDIFVWKTAASIG